MSTNKTENLNLHCWVPEDPFRRGEFNENFAALDENAGKTWNEIMDVRSAVEAAPKIVFGSYIGTGAYGPGKPTTITFDFTPQMLLLWIGTTARVSASSGSENVILRWGYTSTLLYGSYTENRVSYSGKTVSWECYGNTYDNAHSQFNGAGQTYYYMAIG